MEIEAVLVALDVGTSKVVVLVGEVANDGSLDIIGKGTLPSPGVRKGLVNNIEQTVASIHQAVEQAERLSGLRLEAAFVGVGGDHLESLNSRGTVAVSGAHREVTREDIERATEVARAVTIPSNREVLHVLPRDFTVDGQEGVKDPEGMSAIRLEVTTHIVHGSATALQNLTKCVRQAGVRPDELVVASLASGEAVLSETERELGVAVADIGAGTTDIALYARRLALPHRRSCRSAASTSPTTSPSACAPTWSPPSSSRCASARRTQGGRTRPRTSPVEIIDDGVARPARKSDVTEIIDARMRELFEKIGEQIAAHASAHRLPAGLVLTGGGSQLAGVAELGRDVLQIPVRVASPAGVGGLTDHLLTPAYATAIGLLLWAARVVTEQDLQRYEPPPGAAGLEPHARRRAALLPLSQRPAERCAAADRPSDAWPVDQRRQEAVRTPATARARADLGLSARGGAEDILAADDQAVLGSLDRARARRGSRCLEARSGGFPHAVAFRLRELRPHPRHRRRRRRQQRRQPHDPRRADGRRVHRRQHRCPGAPAVGRPQQDPHRRQDHARPRRRRRSQHRPARRRGGLREDRRRPA